MERATAILNFWFGDPQDPNSNYGQQRQAWFIKKADFDVEIKARFLIDYQQAAAGELSGWRETPSCCLALILLLDQFPRNLFRGAPQAFATDGEALATAEWAMAQGFDQQLIPVERIFLYLPFEHSENLIHQQQAVTACYQLWQTHPEFQRTYDYAVRHCQVIERFGRFPHRNGILGRESTSEEVEFLKQPGSSF